MLCGCVFRFLALQVQLFDCIMSVDPVIMSILDIVDSMRFDLGTLLEERVK